MSDALEDVEGLRVLRCAPDGPTVHGEGDVMDLVGTAWFQGAEWVLIPVGRFDPAVFDLSTGRAGEILQKFVNYRVGLAVLGDLSPYTATGSALRGLVHESNGGGQAWFLDDVDAFRARLRDRGQR